MLTNFLRSATSSVCFPVLLANMLTATIIVRPVYAKPVPKPTPNSSTQRLALNHHVFAYIVNRHPVNTLSQFEWNKVLRPLLPTTIKTGDDPIFAAADHINRRLYVVNAAANTITQYNITASGVLSEIGSPLVDNVALNLTISPDGHFAYVVESTGFISEYNIASNGALRLINTKPMVTGFGPLSMAISKSGKCAYVVVQNHGEPTGYNASLLQYRISSNGLLQPTSPPAVPYVSITFPYALSLDPTGRYAYVNTARGILGFKISSTGKMSPMQSSTHNGMNNMEAMESKEHTDKIHDMLTDVDTPAFAINNSGTLAFAIERAQSGEANIIACYKIDPDGSLRSIAKYIISSSGELAKAIGQQLSSTVSVSSLAAGLDENVLFAVNTVNDSVFQYQVVTSKTTISLSLVAVTPTQQPRQIVFVQK